MSVPKVLLVDDVNMFLELEKSFLKLSPVKIFTARDGLEALETIKAERPDVVFMDLNMPRMTGAECCAAVKADPGLCATPIIIITTSGREDDREICAKAGCDGFLTKPVERKSFLEMARRYLQTVERRETRVHCNIPAKLKIQDSVIDGEFLDISERGVYCSIPGGINLGVVVDISFALPEGDRMPIESRGRIVWVNMGSNRKKTMLPEGIGVEFVALPEKLVATIRTYVERRSLPNH